MAFTRSARLMVLAALTSSQSVAGLRTGRKAAREVVSKDKAEAEADGDYSGGDGSEDGDVCVKNWRDTQKFDCQLYEGAGWCDKTKHFSMGYGWCHMSNKCDNTPIVRGGWALQGAQRWGWGTFKGFTNNKFKYTARQVCAGCGAKCPPTPKKRSLNKIADQCVDYSAPNGQVFRGPSGYSCAAYHHGGFCRLVDGQWKNGPLMQGYGNLKNYKHWAMVGKNRQKIHPLQACCTCGGGCQCPTGWKAPRNSKCVREFEYQGKGYSGCTTVANPQVKGGGAWCAHNAKYKRGGWSRCEKCEAGWQPKANSKCASEFTFKGKKYSGCTTRKANATIAFCALDAVARGNRWEKCEKCGVR